MLSGETPSLVATYRLQLTPTFGLGRAAGIVPYLARLGVSHVYTSSYLQASPGSTHGYDTVDHGRVSDELGGEDALVVFHDALRTHGLDHVIDVVPNHMSIADPKSNRRWWNVLREGPDSPDARFFDIDWNAPDPGLSGKVLLPVLGDDYATELANGSIALVQVDGQAEIHYGDLCFPVADPPPSTDPALSGSGLHDILERQHYRLACWRLGAEQLNHRRFFDITTLAGVRVEDPAVFAAVHERSLRWVAQGFVQGLRIDHPDGLRDPTRYLHDLRVAAPDAWIVVEKILETGEPLPTEWPVDGTTGYDAMARLTGVFVDAAAEPALTATFTRFVGDGRTYGAHVAAAKQQVLTEMFGTELSRLERLAVEFYADCVPARDFTRTEIRSAIVALLVAMPVYRTYITVDGTEVECSRRDDAVLDATLARARHSHPSIDSAVFDALEALLRGDPSGCRSPRDTNESLGDFVARFQQLSGPAMAKGVEDTVFYRYNRLLALNEVGADPARFGLRVEEFHTEMATAAQLGPRSMVATSTHDSKRSEDVRARIALLSEVPAEWDAAVQRWRSMNDAAWAGTTPDRSAEYLLYQTMFGAHPLSPERTEQYLVKALREAKQITTWQQPTEAESAVLAFADRIARSTEFQLELAEFADRLAPSARLASVAQLTLKVMTPGVPDFYQGSELWTTSLVDPDNRHDVDWPTRMHLLDEIDAHPGPPPHDVVVGGRAVTKLWLTRRLLHLRRLVPHAFTGASATYAGHDLHGDRAEDAVAFMRAASVFVVVPVRPVLITRQGWGNTSVRLPPGRWIDALGGITATTGPIVSGEPTVAELTRTLGIAVLINAATFGAETLAAGGNELVRADTV